MSRVRLLSPALTPIAGRVARERQRAAYRDLSDRHGLDTPRSFLARLLDQRGSSAGLLGYSTAWSSADLLDLELAGRVGDGALGRDQAQLTLAGVEGLLEHGEDR